MLTLERDVSQLIADLPKQIDCKPQAHATKIYLDFGNLFLQISQKFQERANQIETDWDYYTNTVSSENLENELSNIEELTKQLTSIESTIKEKQQFVNLTLQKGLNALTEALKHYQDVIIDTVESADITDEVRELRSKPLEISRIKEAKEILSFL
ncbi:MAG: hypothetical protein HCA25_24495 [Dolichospermum sp. DET50]|jgi:hypothetical protein|nr:hypothetical protein [Dolichospermum sp. DET66]MBS3035310.1 hypothetical protein [Dolichospermum sp. DET67]MBS3040511.1 hypothetical protein [Dolichospermum sp. DET50]QSX67650.1 MAG: hypothetical protein EZY12_23770 [Dolichospermum sp. DET69]